MPTVPRTSLKNYPDIAMNVGLVVAEYALLEGLMATIYAIISKENPRTAFSDFYDLRSAHLKEELATRAAIDLDAPFQKAYDRLWKRFKKAANRRTEIAHCLFYDHGEGPMRTRTVAGSMHYDRLTDQTFEHTFSQFHTLGTLLLVFAAVVGFHLGRDPRIVTQLPFSPLDPGSFPSMPDQDLSTPAQKTEIIEALTQMGLLQYIHL